jgi:hypothetical protein
MRIAISGTHRSGKSTLVEGLSDSFPEYSTVEEPYYLLAEEGHDFAEMPSIEDFELQLERSIVCLEERDPNVLFDRCPADLLGYLLTHSETEEFDLDRWLPRVQAAMEALDLIVFLPVEERDRIVLSSSEDAELRMLVDEKLKEIFLENPFGFEVDVLEVTGAPHERIQRVMAYLQRGASKK